MNKGLNIFLVILLCVVLYIGLLMSFYSSDNSDSWNPQQGYTMPMGGKSSTSAVSVGGGSTSTGVSVPMRSVSRSMRSSRAVSLYAPAQNSSVAHTQYPVGGTPSNNVASPMYTTSSATMKSFGGGTNGAVSMSSGVVSSNATSSPTSFVSMSSNLPSPLAYYPQSTTSFDGAQLTFAASSLQEIGASAVSYGASAPRGISGRRNVSPGISNQYYGWLTSWWGEDESGKGWAHNTGGAITIEELEALFYAMTGNTPYSNPQAWESFYNWFMNQINTNGEVSYNGYSWYLPLSDAIPFVLLLCLVYVWTVYRKTRKRIA